MADLDRAVKEVAGEVWTSRALYESLASLCARGGRFCGTESERSAREYLKARLADYGLPVGTHGFDYAGWSRGSCDLRLVTPGGARIPAVSLVQGPNTPAGGIEMPLVDLGRGTLEDFEERREAIRGAMALVSHEYPFAQAHIHRRRKIDWAVERGAAAFAIANHVPGHLVISGSSGPGRPGAIPAIGLSFEDGAHLRRLAARGPVRVRLEVQNATRADRSENVTAELPGETDEWVLVTCHYDAHDVGQGAIDNGSGCAVALEVARALAGLRRRLRRGLRVIAFSVEEWGLKGSACYADELPPEERRRIAVDFNLDCVAGSPNFTWVLNGFPELGPFLQGVGRNVGFQVGISYQLAANSDHYNFVRHGVPAIRLMAGYEEPECAIKYILSPGDTLDKVRETDLKMAAFITTQTALAACRHPEAIARHRTAEEMRARVGKFV
jgi:Zn-dependent M28 family amino/carboxypeptidase